MLKKILFAAAIMICLFAKQGMAFAGPAQESEKKDLTNMAASMAAENYAGTKYAAAGAMVYQFQDETAPVLDTALINTSFEVVLEKDGWSMVTTASGYAFIKSALLAAQEAPVYHYSDEELYVMAHVLAGEAQNCSDEEQLYVGSVVLNRVAHPQFPNTIKGVVFQKGQYACTRDRNYYREPTERNWANARALLDGGSVLPPNIIWQSGRKQGKGVYIKTRWHYYCY